MPGTQEAFCYLASPLLLLAGTLVGLVAVPACFIPEGPQSESKAGEAVMGPGDRGQGHAEGHRERLPYNAPEVTQLLLHVIFFLSFFSPLWR